MVRNQILSLVIISSFLARKRSVPCWWLGCFEHHRFVRLERRLVGTQRTELWPRWTRKLEHGVWCVSIKLPTKKMHQGTDQYPMRTNSSRNLIMVNFSAYLNKFETFFTVTLASTGVSSRLTMIIGSTTRPSAPERTPSVRKTRLATTSTTTPCPRSTSQVGSLTQFYSLSFLLAIKDRWKKYLLFLQNHGSFAPSTAHLTVSFCLCSCLRKMWAWKRTIPLWPNQNAFFSKGVYSS